MAFPARQVVAEAYYVSSIVARSLETVDGQQASDGLSLLNRVLSQQNVTAILIPYYQTYAFNAVIGQELYFIENLIEIDVETFEIGGIRIPTREIQRKRYFGSARALNVNSLPLSWNQQRVKGGTNLRMYFAPAAAYPIKFIGKFGLTSVTEDTDLSLTYDLFYIDYLIYALARRICADNNIQFSPENEQTLASKEEELMYLSPLDLSVVKISTLQRRSGYSYADINLGRGWIPPL